MNKLPNVSCPTCQIENTWRDDNPLKPFCSQRCKLIDLGDWAAENHSIAGEPTNSWLKDDKSE